MQLDGESIQMTDVQRAKVAVEGVVQQRLVDAEVDGGKRLVGGDSGTAMCARRALRGRLRLLGVGEGRRGIWSIRIRGQVEAVLDVLEGGWISTSSNGCLFWQLLCALTSMTWP